MIKENNAYMLDLLKHKKGIIKGMTLIEVMIAAAIIGILVAIAVPNFDKIRSKVYTDECITNLRRIATAKEHWSLETGAADTAIPTALQLDPYIKDGTTALVCPLDSTATFATSYDIKDIANNPACKIAPAAHVLQ